MREKIGVTILLIIFGFFLAAAARQHELSIELTKLEITETKLSIEKLNFELAIYREQESLVVSVD